MENGEWSGRVFFHSENRSRECTQRSIHCVASLRGGNKKVPRGILKTYKIGCTQRHERDCSSGMNAGRTKETDAFGLLQ